VSARPDGTVRYRTSTNNEDVGPLTLAGGVIVYQAGAIYDICSDVTYAERQRDLGSRPALFPARIDPQ
jgi:hypothetical protein